MKKTNWFILKSCLRLKADRRMKGGFTLIETLVVVMIIGLLASIVLFSTTRARSDARDGRRKADLSSLKTALELYYDRNGTYVLTMKDTSAINLTLGTKIQISCPETGTPASVNRALIDWGFITNQIKDPQQNADCGSTTGQNYMINVFSQTKYCIMAHLENPNYPTGCSGVGCWDSDSSNITQSDKSLLGRTLDTPPLNMNYALGNGC